MKRFRKVTITSVITLNSIFSVNSLSASIDPMLLRFQNFSEKFGSIDYDPIRSNELVRYLNINFLTENTKENSPETYTLALYLRSQAFLALSLTHDILRKHDALDDIEELLKRKISDKTQKEALWNRAILLRETEKYEEAIEQFELFATQYPDSAKTFIELSRVYLNLDDIDTAIDTLKRIAPIQELPREAQGWMGIYLMLNGDEQEALDLLKNSNSDSRTTRTKFAIAKADLEIRFKEYLFESDKLRIISDLDAAINEAPNDPDLRMLRFRLLKDTGNFKKAFEDLDFLITSDEDNPNMDNLFFEMGQLLLEFGEQETAKWYFTNAIEMELSKKELYNRPPDQLKLAIYYAFSNQDHLLQPIFEKLDLATKRRVIEYFVGVSSKMKNYTIKKLSAITL